jgi:hypothetical protein
MRFLARHKWSVASLGLSSATLLLALSTGAHYVGQPQPEPRLGLALGLMDVSAMLAAFLTACIGLCKETPRGYAFVALLLSVVSFLSYVSQ